MKDVLKHYIHPAFIICVVVLALAGGGMSFMQSHFKIWLSKEPWPLKKSLDLLDEKQLAPYKVISKSEIENPDVVEGLGTKDYIQWILEDTEAQEDSPVRHVNLFITYFELPDIVVHVPEECYTGGGYQRLGVQTVYFDVNLPDTESDNKIGKTTQKARILPGKYIIFGRPNADPWDSRSKFPVLYLIRVNDEYVNNRRDARLTLSKNVFGKHSYYSKVEMAFNVGSVVPDKNTAVLAGRKVLSVVLPVLEKEHWPHFKEQEK